MSTGSSYSPSTTTCRTVQADGIEVFYRESGAPDSPTLLLLHGFPTSSFQYRNLLTRLGSRYRLIAPDLPGFGFTMVPKERGYAYTFENFAKTIEAFVDVIGLKRYALYIFDYGAPTGLRLALSRPHAITAIISQNGNAFEEGLGAFWDDIRRYWAKPTSENREAIRWLTSMDATKWQYFTGETNTSQIPPETYTLDKALMDRPGNVDIQLDLFLDYGNNLPLYPKFQQYLQTTRPPVLAIWGANDQIFIPAGAHAFKRVMGDGAEVVLVNGGHFVLELHLEEIATAIEKFLEGLK